MSHRVPDVAIADYETAGEQVFVQRERQFARLRHQQGIADRTACAFVLLSRPRSDRSPVIVKAFRFDAVDFGVGKLVLHCYRNPSCKATAADRHEHRVDISCPALACRAISRPTVPCPAITTGSSKGATKSAFSFSQRSRAI